MRVILTGFALMAGLGFGAAMAAATADEIKAALVGNTFQGGMGGGDYTSFFGTDGMYKDSTGTGAYTITADGVCYPGTDFGCYAAEIKGSTLEWFKDGKSAGSGSILPGNPLKL